MRACACAAPWRTSFLKRSSAPSTGPRQAMRRCTSPGSSCACAYRISKRSPNASPRRSTKRSGAKFDFNPWTGKWKRRWTPRGAAGVPRYRHSRLACRARRSRRRRLRAARHLAENLTAVAQRGPPTGAVFSNRLQFYFRLLALLPLEQWPLLAAVSSTPGKRADPAEVAAAVATLLRRRRTIQRRSCRRRSRSRADPRMPRSPRSSPCAFPSGTGHSVSLPPSSPTRASRRPPGRSVHLKWSRLQPACSRFLPLQSPSATLRKKRDRHRASLRRAWSQSRDTMKKRSRNRSP